jgi:glycerophosphoryl diester phosphodiesterase
MSTQARRRTLQILCHRGWWDDPAERNSAAALRRAFEAGLGVETDLRDLNGSVVVSHDPPAGDVLGLDDLLALHQVAPRATLALNIKADGLAGPVAEALAGAGVTASSFVFDMAVPDQLQWVRRGEVPVFTRHSDIEPDPVLYERSCGVWLDNFGERRWWDAADVRRHLDAGKRVIVVSDELHGRPHGDTWAALRASGLHREGAVGLCTDLVGEALEYFRCDTGDTGEACSGEWS